MRALEHLRVRPGAVRGPRPSHNPRWGHGAKGDTGKLRSCPPEQPSAVKAESGQTPWVGSPQRDPSSGRGAVLLPQAARAGVALVIKTGQEYMDLLNLLFL